MSDSGNESGTGPYETKTVRVHLPDLGRYVYLMMTRLDGDDHLLGDEGWRGTYIHYSIISRNAQHQDAVTGDAWALIRQNDWLKGTAAELLVKALEMDDIRWSDLEDGQKLSDGEVGELTGNPEATA